jgi:predicted nucleic acid-binding protein
VKKILIDTCVYIDWLNQGRHEEAMLGNGLVRYLSAVVAMELRAGAQHRGARDATGALVRAYRSAGRLVVPSSDVYERAGGVLRQLKLAGRDVRQASLCNDVLIALTARSIGATVVTLNLDDFAAIRRIERFDVVPP